MFEKRKFDPIVIGAGVSGVIAANILVKYGYKTLLIEKNDHVGGWCVNIKRVDFLFNVGVHFINNTGKDGSLDKILMCMSQVNRCHSC